jgi:hypothetical protein
LKLVVVLQAVGVFAIAAVGGTAAGLHIGGIPGFRADGAQKGGGMKSAGAHFHVIGLDDDTALAGPEVLELENQVLKGQAGGNRVSPFS